MLRASSYRRIACGLGCAIVLLPFLSACAFTAPQLAGATAVPSSRTMAVASAAPDDYVPPLSYATDEPIAAPSSGALNAKIGHYAALYRIPESLLRRVIVRESNYNPRARNGPYLGLMQIRYDTARSMGYAGSPAGLLDAETNLRYAGKYLAGAYLVANGDPEKAVSFYATGYYYDARRMGLLEEVGLKHAK